MPTLPRKRRLPGDFTPAVSPAADLRIDHAGEYGAKRIYAGQLAVLKNDPAATEIHHMAEQEAVHLATFEKLLPQHHVRPSVLMPLWHVGGWLMGAVPALFGARAAMATTVAVETVIAEHYANQLAQGTVDASLQRTIAQFRDEELEHHAIGLKHDAQGTPLYAPLTTLIDAVCRTAIAVSRRL